MDLDLNKEFNSIINNIDVNNKPNLFLHVCCGPCSTSVLKRLYGYFNLYYIFYNPNIDTKFEFDKRFVEFKKVLDINDLKFNVLYNDYCHNEFLDIIKGHENDREGTKRCHICYKLRLEHSKLIAIEYIKNKKLKNNYLSTTLSVSPYKNAKFLYEIGNEICNKDFELISYLPSDFKKEDGYLKSIQLSKEYKLYRQDYCGCEFSKNV